MALSGSEQRLLRVSKAPQKLMASFREGVFITTVTARTLDDLRDQACLDRLNLADEFRAVGDRLIRGAAPQYRSAISRYYYSMYHAMRATVFFVNDGDDHERHEELPRHTPQDFPQNEVWGNRLKDARGYRNDADYDPYPLSHLDFKQPALDLKRQAKDLTDAVRAYLMSKGCAHL